MKRKRLLCLLITPYYKPGDPPPPAHDYLGWHEWVRIQYESGLRQTLRPDGKWRFPQDSDQGTML